MFFESVWWTSSRVQVDVTVNGSVNIKKSDFWMESGVCRVLTQNLNDGGPGVRVRPDQTGKLLFINQLVIHQ